MCFRQWFIDELTASPINIILLIAILYLLYKILRPESEDDLPAYEPPPPPMKKQDFTHAQLREYDGVKREDGRVLMGVLGKVCIFVKGPKEIKRHRITGNTFAGGRLPIYVCLW